MRKTSMRSTSSTATNHDADAIADAQAHADAIAKDEAAVTAEDAAFAARGRAVDAAEFEKSEKRTNEIARWKIKLAIRAEVVRFQNEIDRVVAKIMKKYITTKSIEYHWLITRLEYLGYDRDEMITTLSCSPKFTIEGGYVRERR